MSVYKFDGSVEMVFRRAKFQVKVDGLFYPPRYPQSPEIELHVVEVLPISDKPLAASFVARQLDESDKIFEILTDAKFLFLQDKLISAIERGDIEVHPV